MSFYASHIITLLLVGGILLGIKLMSSPSTAKTGNMLGAVCILGSVIFTLLVNGIISVAMLWIAMLIGTGIGYLFAVRVAMTQMPQLVALLNGFGGGASAIVAVITLNVATEGATSSSTIAAVLALAVGSLTFSGSMVAAAKLDRRLSPLPVVIPGHSFFAVLLLTIMAGLVLLVYRIPPGGLILSTACLAALVFGVLMSIRIGGADMPITISLLNSLSGIAAAIAGFAISSTLLVAVGAIVGSAGLFLTQIMCRAMNRRLIQILTGRDVSSAPPPGRLFFEEELLREEEPSLSEPQPEALPSDEAAAAVIREASRVIIVPGYGMALSQAQHQVKALFDTLQKQGKEVIFGIHLVAGRMPGHMSLLLVEAGVPFDRLVQMKEVNQRFADCDVVIVVGANDIVNPAANTAEGTPIYGMPVLNVTEAKHVIVCNLDKSPGYAGVDNPLYEKSEQITLLLGDAAENLGSLLKKLDQPGDKEA